MARIAKATKLTPCFVVVHGARKPVVKAWQGGETPATTTRTRNATMKMKTKQAKGKATRRGQAPEPQKDARRMLTAVEYRALEKAAHSLETALKIRRKYQFAVLNATECVEKSIDKIFAIVRGEGGAK